MKDYYSVLGVRQFAGIAEVRRSYRMLVQKYHPDVNPDPSAAIVIREINEAYEVLGDAQKKAAYDASLINPYIEQTPVTHPAHRDPRYRRNYRPVKKENQQRVLMKEYMPYAVNAGAAGFAVCLFLLLDLCLPKRVIHDTIHALYRETAGKVVTHYVTTESGRELKISREDMDKLERARPIDIIETGITKTLITLYFPHKKHRITNLATIYRNYAFVPVILLITSTLCLFLKRSVEFRFNLGIVSFFLLIFTLVLMIK